MAERVVVVDKLRLTYEGLFSVSELYRFIDEYFEDKGYDKREKKNIENVTPTGKYIEIEVEPWKKVTDHAMNVIRLRMIFENIKEVEVEKDGRKMVLNQGKAHFLFDAFLYTDYFHKWEGKPIYFVIRTIFDKYVYAPYTQGFVAGVKEDTLHLHGNIKAFLNLYRF
ncbi:hypothetical protein J4410_01440 [Candidatus Woesearchaeota archaeon]|nr:hypothetical protein [Candidatus Woesearchaeota archaeon]